MTKLFTPSPGPWCYSAQHGHWCIEDAQRRRIANVCGDGKTPLWMTECDTRLVRGAPDMMRTLVTIHNKLGLIAEAHNPAAMANKMQEQIRTMLTKMMGDDVEPLTHFNNEILILPEETDG